MERKSINISLIVAVVLALTTIGGLAAFVWAYQQMEHYKNDTDQITAEAVIVAKQEQFQADETNFLEEAKKPYTTFSGPADFGSVGFEYPKTWSVYNNKNDGSGYLAYFHPGIVPPVVDTTPLALRLEIMNRAYDEVVKSYQNSVTKGDLTATPLTIGKTEDFKGYEGIRFDGQLTDKLDGALVLFRIRDKTLSLRVDASDYLGDFDEIVLASLKFVP
jgi:hypothetical protein